MANSGGHYLQRTNATEGHAEISGDVILRAYGGGYLVTTILSALSRIPPATTVDASSPSSSLTLSGATRATMTAAGVSGGSSKVSDFARK